MQGHPTPHPGGSVLAVIGAAFLACACAWPTSATAAPATTTDGPTIAPAETPSLPPYDFSVKARRDPANLAALRADTHARLLDGNWESHLRRLQAGLKAAVNATKPDAEGKAFDELARDPLFALGAAQASLIGRLNSTDGFSTRTAPETLRQLMQTEGFSGFLEDLLGKPASMQAFLAQVKPEDDAPAALQSWSLVWNAEPLPLRGKYLNLQVAFALVFDRGLTAAAEPPEPIDPAKRYAFFRDAAEANQLKTDLTRLPVEALIWVIGTEDADTDLHWAHQEPRLRHLPISEWGKTYEIVESGGALAKEMAPKNRGSGPNTEPQLTQTQKDRLAEVDAGSLEALFKFGGDPVVFSVGAAQAFGIPAAKLTSRTSPSQHPPTWVGFQRETRRWDLSLGRPARGAAGGVAIDPQTLLPVREFELTALTDRKRETPEGERCVRLRLLARIAGQVGEPERQLACLAAACRTLPRCLPAWQERLAALATVAPATAPWTEVLRELRQTFDGEPDMRDVADEYEARFLLVRLPVSEAVRTIQGHLQKLRREHPDRRDLVVAGISRAGRLLARDRVTNATALSTLYRGALEDAAGDMNEFQGLLADYYAIVKGDEKLELRFLDDAEHVFRRKVELPPLEFQEMTEALYVYFRKCGQSHRGFRLRSEGEKAKQAALKESK